MGVPPAFPEPASRFTWTHETWGPALRCAPLALLADHLFTTRGLTLDGAGKGDGWRALARTVAVADAALVRPSQVHGTGVLVVRRSDCAAVEQDGRVADIVVGDRPDVAIAVQTADCVPLLVADRQTGTVAAAHVGWRGAAARAPIAAVEAMAREFGSRPRDLVAAIGPSIGPCCYEVGEDVREAFANARFAAEEMGRWFVRGRRDRPHLDMWQATRDQLLTAGLQAGAVHACGLCTATWREVFCSYRGDGPGTGRIAGVIRSKGRADDVEPSGRTR